MMKRVTIAIVATLCATMVASFEDPKKDPNLYIQTDATGRVASLKKGSGQNQRGSSKEEG